MLWGTWQNTVHRALNHHSVEGTSASRGNKCQLMAQSLLRLVTEPAVFVAEVAKQHEVFARAINYRVLVSARASL